MKSKALLKYDAGVFGREIEREGGREREREMLFLDTIIV